MQQCISWREQHWRRSPSLVVRLSHLRFIVRLLLSIWLISCTSEPARVAKISVFLPWSSRRNCFCSTDDWCWRSDWWKPVCPCLSACAREWKHLLLGKLLALLQPSNGKACIPRHCCLLYRRTCPCFWWLQCIFKSACTVEISRRYFWCYPTRRCTYLLGSSNPRCVCLLGCFCNDIQQFWD